MKCVNLNAAALKFRKPIHKNKDQSEAEEYKIDFDDQGGWEVLKYIPAHYQPWFTADTKEQAEARLQELQCEK